MRRRIPLMRPIAARASQSLIAPRRSPATGSRELHEASAQPTHIRAGPDMCSVSCGPLTPGAGAGPERPGPGRRRCARSGAERRSRRQCGPGPGSWAPEGAGRHPCRREGSRGEGGRLAPPLARRPGCAHVHARGMLVYPPACGHVRRRARRRRFSTPSV